MNAPAWAASGAAFSGSGASVDIAAPTGMVAGQIAIADFFIDGVTNQNVVAPAGWFAAENTPIQAANHWKYVFWHRASGAESGPYTFTWDASVFREGQAHRYSGCVASGTPFDAGAAFAVDNTAGTTTPAVSITTLGDDRCLVHAATCWAGGTWTPPSAPVAFTKREQPSVGLSTLADATFASAGATGNVTATVSNADKRTAWLGALKPVVTINVTGTGSAPLGGLAGAASGVRTVLGSAAAALGFGALATGVRATTGTATAPLGALASHATAAGAGQQTQAGGWDTLLAISQYAQRLRAEDLARLATNPEACPNDGEPLRTAPDGGLYCPWDLWRPGP